MKEIKKRFWLEKFTSFSISGRDAKKFLNGITTRNIIDSANKVIKACFLTPNGVLRALLEVVFLEKELYLVILEGDTNELIDYFKMIIFPSDKVFLGEPFFINRFQEVDESNSWKNYQPIFFKNDDKEYLNYKNKLNLLNLSELTSWKINQAIPTFNNEIDGNNNPLELGLTDLIDFNKGCFLGQETMSKIKNVSTLKQEIRVWKATDSILNLESENKKLYENSDKESVVGKITSSYKLDLQIKGLAMIKRKYLERQNSFYSEIFGQIIIEKSQGSHFL